MKSDERIQQPVDLGLKEGKIESGDSCFTNPDKRKPNALALGRGSSIHSPFTVNN